jgi:hypothetical protein
MSSTPIDLSFSVETVQQGDLLRTKYVVLTYKDQPDETGEITGKVVVRIEKVWQSHKMHGSKSLFPKRFSSPD